MADREPAGEPAAEGAAEETRWRGRARGAGKVAFNIGYLAILIASWEGLVRLSGIRSYLLPPPSAVAVEMFETFPHLMRHTWVTASEAIAGFALAGIAGVFVAIWIVYSPAIRGVAMPTLVAFNAVPKVALAPLLVVYVGIGFESKLAMAFLISFFPIVVNATTGMSDVEPELLNLLRIMRSNQRQMFMKIRLPHALPGIFDGLKIALPLSIIGAIVGEFVAANEGLGHLIIVSGLRLNTALVFASVIIIAVLSVTLYQILVFTETRALRWRPSER